LGEHVEDDMDESRMQEDGSDESESQNFGPEPLQP
jgi:hypothetical protein